MESAHASSGPARGGPEEERLSEGYRLLHRIGEGGMGEVWLAEDVQLRVLRAIKLVRPELLRTPEAVDLFLHEARSHARIQHPNVVTVHALTRLDGRAAIVMEHVAGPSLADEIETERARRARHGDRRPKADPERRSWQRRVAGIVAAIADALAVCHRDGTLHRDIKPSNILGCTDHDAKLGDFGIAKSLRPDPAARGVARETGTLAYMSPERIRASDNPVDHRSDIFSLGVVLYEALTLQRPFDGATERELRDSILDAAPTRPCALDPTIPKELEKLTLAALEKDPDARFRTVEMIAAVLRNWLAGGPGMVTEPSLFRRVLLAARRHRERVALGALAVLIVVATALSVMLRDAQDARDGFVSVVGPAGARVFVQRTDPRILDFEPVADEVGLAPIGVLRLPPGQYRITVVPSADAFVEFNVRLESGRERIVHLVTLAPGEPWPIADQRTLVGVATPLEAIRDDMVAVIADVYPVGQDPPSDIEPIGESPLHRARARRMAGSFIDRYEVSNAEYGAFMAATGAPPPVIWTDPTDDPDFAARPVVGVSVGQAEAYARWRGKRLPTAWEWEAAVRGARGRILPWDDETAEVAESLIAALESAAPDENALDARLSTMAEVLRVHHEHTVPVRSPDPLADLLGGIAHAHGNVREITATIEPSTGAILIKGRGWTDSPTRVTLASIFTHPHGISDDHGFRCARSATPPRLRDDP